LYQYEESAKGLFLIMEYVEGKSLKEMLEAIKKPMEEAQAIDLFKQILAAFEYAHHEKLVHRDVKPANIMVDKKGQAKVLDFGIAKALDTNNEMTMTGTQMGTLKYMSPEQVHDSKRIDQRSDIYSLGVTLYTLLSNSTPYDRMESRLDIQIAIAKDMLPNIRSINPKVSAQTAQTIQKATAKKPEDRFRSCKDFKEALMASSFKREQIKNTPSSSFGSEQETIIDTPNSYPPKHKAEEETILDNQNKNLSEKKLKETLRKMANEQSSKGSATSTPKKNTGKNFFTSKVKIALGLIVGIGLMLFLANRFASTGSGGYEAENYQEVGGETKAGNTSNIAGRWHSTAESDFYDVSLGDNNSIYLDGKNFSGTFYKSDADKWAGSLNSKSSNFTASVQVYIDGSGNLVLFNQNQGKNYYFTK
jgi:serine/threonine protein kinase